MTDHHHYMQLALRLARRQLGQTWPNPAVGAVIVRDGMMVAQGVTERGGRPHAETQAIAQAGDMARGSCIYVSLEPCSHQGKTGPCAQAIIDAGISQVVVACRDINPLISGRGIALLQQAGIRVIEGVCEAEARALNAGFFSVVERGRPLISLKIATSLDGKIASSAGESQWITSEKARERAWLLRSQYDCVATGSGTILADDPLLTVRLAGLEQKSPVRVVFDRGNRVLPTHRVVLGAKEVPLWHISGQKHPKQAELEALGVQFLAAEALHAAVELIAKQGITRMLVEAGTTLSTAFLQSGLVDRIYWFRAPIMLGNDGLAGIGGGFAPSLSDATRWKLVEQHSIGSDQLDVFACLPVLLAT